jgi:hypothetical protein
MDTMQFTLPFNQKKNNWMGGWVCVWFLPLLPPLYVIMQNTFYICIFFLFSRKYKFNVSVYYANESEIENGKKKKQTVQGRVYR